MPAQTAASWRSWKPTRKISAVAISGALIALARVFVDVDPQTEDAVNLLVPVILGYILHNHPNTPRGDGVPA